MSDPESNPSAPSGPIKELSGRIGKYDIVKASITGSIIGNVLLVLGLSILVGGLRYPRQTFNRTAATNTAVMLFLAVVALVVAASEENRPAILAGFAALFVAARRRA